MAYDWSNQLLQKILSCLQKYDVTTQCDDKKEYNIQMDKLMPKELRLCEAGHNE